MSDDVRIQAGPPEPQGPGEDPLYYYTRLFVRFLQAVFASFDKGDFHWCLDQNLTEIQISDQATIAREAVEQRPAILIARGPARFGNLALDQFAGPTFKKGVFQPSSDNTSGRKKYTDLVSSSVTYNCISSEGVEAQRLAWISAMATRRMKRTLMRLGLHRVGEEVDVGSESPPGAIVTGEPSEIILVPVTVPFFFQDFWSIEPVDKVLLKEIDIALRSQVNYPEPGQVALNAPAMNGKILQYDRNKVFSLTSRVKVTGSNGPKPR